jgi:hypothetical protein
MPVAQFLGKRNWGYDGAYPYAVQNSHGGNKSFKLLINELISNSFSFYCIPAFARFLRGQGAWE